MKTTEFVCNACKSVFCLPITIYDSKGTSEPKMYEKSTGCPSCRFDGYDKKELISLNKKELSQYIQLTREIERENNKLISMKESGKNTSELYELIENNKLRQMTLLIKTQQFIYSIDDSLTRQIFELRYIKGLKWAAVATETGGYYSADYVRIIHDRYLKSRSAAF